MAEPPRYRETDDDTRAGPDRAPPAGTPRWVKVFGLIALVVVLLFLILQFVGGGGDHGPGRHTGARDTFPADVTAVAGAQTAAGDDLCGHALAPGTPDGGRW